MQNSFVTDMETGGYAPPSSNAIRRLNEVTEKWEKLITEGGVEDDDDVSFISTDSDYDTQEDDEFETPSTPPSAPAVRRQLGFSDEDVPKSNPVPIPGRSSVDEGAKSYATAVQWVAPVAPPKLQRAHSIRHEQPETHNHSNFQ